GFRSVGLRCFVGLTNVGAVSPGNLAMNEPILTAPGAANPAEAAPPAPAEPGASRARIGVLLLNLGTPDSADVPGVRRYLKEFLSDPRVIEKQGLAWQALLHGPSLRIPP